MDEKMATDVRLYEAIQGAHRVGVQRVGVLITKNGQIGMDEWLENPQDKKIKDLGIALARKYNPDVIYSPHPDQKLDTHPDHTLVAAIAEWAWKWGTENAFYQQRYQGEAVNLKAWRRYAVWKTGPHNLVPNYGTQYAPLMESTLGIDLSLLEGDDDDRAFAQMKREAIKQFQSQLGEVYMIAAMSGDVSQGAMRYVGNNQLWALELFDEVKGMTINKPKWKQCKEKVDPKESWAYEI